jgi:hypothetical protein
MANKAVAVAVFDSHEHAVGVVRDLYDIGFDMQSLSIVGKGFYSGNQNIGDNHMRPRMQAWGRLGEFWGTIWGIVAESSFFRFSDLGSVLVAGPLVLRVVAAMDRSGAPGVANALAIALASVGIPQNRVVHYEFLVKMDKVLLIVHGAAADVELSRNHLHNVPLDVHSDPVALVA